MGNRGVPPGNGLEGLKKSFKSFRMVHLKGDSRYAIPHIKKECNAGQPVDFFRLITCIIHLQFKTHIIS